MKTTYRSTRGGVTGLTFEQTVLTGLSKDGGLMVPEQFPSIPPNALNEWRHLSYEDLAFEVMSLFISRDEIPAQDLRQLIASSYNVPNVFREKEITPVKHIHDNMYIMEMFHGPTFAFKDVALQFLGNLFEYFLKRKNSRKSEGEENERIVIAGATSGDTGSAAIYGLRGKENVEVYIMYPEGRVSEIQERQMITVLDENVCNLAVKGTFDDCQATVKALFADASFKKNYNLGAVNSINWARILAQIVYYVHGYFQILNKYPDASKNVSFCVPSGNFGNVLAGYYAKKIGIPIARFCVATNENDILHRFFSSGKYHKHDVTQTVAPSMDITVSSNFERYLFALADDNSETLSQWMAEFKKSGKITVEGSKLANAQQEMLSSASTHEEIMETIKEYWRSYEYLLDPHSAIGVAAVHDLNLVSKSKIEQETVVVVATASPGKFLPTVEKAVSTISSAEAKALPPQHPLLDGLACLPTRNFVIDNSVQEVKNFIISKEESKKKKSKVDQCCNLHNSTLVKTGVVFGCVCIGLAIISRLRK